MGEHRATGWAAIGATLVVIGVSVGTGLGLYGASSHLWGDWVFLVGFAFASVLFALGIYVLVAEFIGRIGPLQLPLPQTRLERASAESARPQRLDMRLDLDESLDQWLAERQSDIGKLRSQLAEMVAADGFQAARARSTEGHFWEINAEVDRKLHIDARGWVDYFNENPSNFPLNLTLIQPEQFRDYTLPLMDTTVNQIAHIRARLREGLDAP